MPMWDLLSPAELEWKAVCRRFAAEAIAPRAREYDERNDFPRAVHERARAPEWGLLNTAIPEALGGRGMTHRALVVGGEELAAACAPIAFTMGFNHGALRPVLEAGTEEQKGRFVRDLVGRGGYAAIALTEEGTSGSNLLAEVATRAVSTPGGYSIRGAKCMVGNGAVADLFVVLADTVVDGRRRGPSFFVVPRGAEGVRVGPNPLKIGFRALTTPTVHLDDVEVPPENVLGAVGGAEDVLLRSLDYIRFGGASVILGIAVGALRDVVPWVEERRVYPGEPLVAKSHVQLDLADLYTQVQLVRLMLWRAADLLDAGKPCSTETSMAKLAASRLAVEATNRVVQMHGWRGLVADDDRFRAEKRLRDARVTTVYEGTSEVQLLHIFRELRRSAQAGGDL